MFLGKQHYLADLKGFKYEHAQFYINQESPFILLFKGLFNNNSHLYITLKFSEHFYTHYLLASNIQDSGAEKNLTGYFQKLLH